MSHTATIKNSPPTKKINKFNIKKTKEDFTKHSIGLASPGAMVDNDHPVRACNSQSPTQRRRWCRHSSRSSYPNVGRRIRIPPSSNPEIPIKQTRVFSKGRANIWATLKKDRPVHEWKMGREQRRRAHAGGFGRAPTSARGGRLLSGEAFPVAMQRRRRAGAIFGPFGPGLRFYIPGPHLPTLHRRPSRWWQRR